MMRPWIWIAVLAVAACGPNRREQAAEHAAREEALAAGAAARQASATAAPAVTLPRQVAADALPVGMPPTPVQLTELSCEDGSQRTLRYFPEQGIAILMPDGVGRELQMEPVASGVRYAGGGTVVTGEGTQYLIARDGADPIACTAAG